MNLSTEILTGALIVGSMAIQFGRRRVNPFRILLPLGLVVYFAGRYLGGLDLVGNDLAFAGIGLLLGTLMGAVAGSLQRVERDAVGIWIVSGAAYIAVWAAVFAARSGFAWGVANVFGRQVGIFSYQHQLTEAGWVAFFVLQAIAMVAVRTLVVGARVLGSLRVAPAIAAS
jgi:hypothetical protein